MKKQIQLLAFLSIASTIVMAKDHIVRCDKPYIITTESELEVKKLKNERNHDLFLATMGIYLGCTSLFYAAEKTAKINRSFIEKNMAALNHDFGNLNA